jgi:hypothetical protein
MMVVDYLSKNVSVDRLTSVSHVMMNRHAHNLSYVEVWNVVKETPKQYQLKQDKSSYIKRLNKSDIGYLNCNTTWTLVGDEQLALKNYYDMRLSNSLRQLNNLNTDIAFYKKQLEDLNNA